MDVLDFSDFPDVHGFGALDEIYTVVNGILNPPPEFLTSGARVRKWRGQQYEIDKILEANAKRAVTASRNRGRVSHLYGMILFGDRRNTLHEQRIT